MNKIKIKTLDGEVCWVDVVELPPFLIPTSFLGDLDVPACGVLVLLVPVDDDFGIFSNIKSRSKSFKLDHPSMSSADSSLLVVARCFSNASNKQFT